VVPPSSLRANHADGDNRISLTLPPRTIMRVVNSTSEFQVWVRPVTASMAAARVVCVCTWSINSWLSVYLLKQHISARIQREVVRERTHSREGVRERKSAIEKISRERAREREALKERRERTKHQHAQLLHAAGAGAEDAAEVHVHGAVTVAGNVEQERAEGCHVHDGEVGVAGGHGFVHGLQTAHVGHVPNELLVLLEKVKRREYERTRERDTDK